ncbi:OmpA family protein [Hymenobacter terrenus]|uniref:OmpA family protein n=1 Tax=Hymenobacter terrenus TaxID=1629124 RepID=UPI0018CF96F5|nr:OmpA family protein [Hymenobacter terrenus]
MIELSDVPEYLMRLPSLFIKVFLLLLLAQVPLCAQESPAPAIYTDAQARYQLTYPRTWQMRKNAGPVEATFTAGSPPGAPPALATLTVMPMLDKQKEVKLLERGVLDSVWRGVQRLPRIQVLRFDQRDAGSYEEIRYDYTYAPSLTAPARTHVVGRRVWRGGFEFRTEYRGDASQDGQYLAEAQQLVGSFAFTKTAFLRNRYAEQTCDNKMYGISAMRLRNGQWEDDCRTIHEFSSNNLKAAPIIHRQALPFQSYALAKGFDNCLYSVTKAPTDAPEFVYRYDPATRQGRYMPWQLPAQGPENVWISAATDDHGDLHFLTSDANQLVKVSPRDGRVTVIWAADPVRQAPYYPIVAFPGAGTHGNFCLDDANTMYLVYSTDGSILKVNLTTGKAAPERIPLTGLPARGGYSDLLMQNDEAGRRRLYLAGPHSLYKVDLARHQARLVRRGTYTDLAGCNLFNVVPPPTPVPVPPPPTTATWRGRVLDAVTYQPLPQANLRLEQAQAGTAVLLTAQGSFSYTTVPGRTYAYRAYLSGYVTSDSAWTAAPGSAMRDILLQPLTVGTTLPLSNVQFEQGQAVLLPTSFPALDKLVSLMLENPRMTIELRGHTDNVGPPEKNVVLSEQRVEAVRAYLVSRGLARARIAGIGFGGAQPIASNNQEATRQLNRRVEFRVTAMQ